SGSSTFVATTATPLSQLVVRTSTSTTLSVSGPVVFGQPVTYTATVTGLPPDTRAPPGQVRFVIDGAQQTPVSLNAAGKATFTLTKPNAGTHTASADYLGSTNFALSSTAAPASQTVSKAPTSMTVGSSGNTTFGQPVTFTATVTTPAPGAGTPSGLVQFVIDGVAQPLVALNASGQAGITRTDLS